MPELPEVETIRRDLERLIVGRRIVDVEADSLKQVKPSLAIVKEAVLGVTIVKVERRAKMLQIFLSNGKILAVHLKLTGRLLVRKKTDKKDDFQRILMKLGGDKELRFCDARKFGWIKLIENKEELEKILADFGPEPLDDLTLEKFKKILRESNRAIKIVLMDQKKIAGVGNIYANDALFLARIDPRRPAKKLRNEEIKKLYEAIEKVLKAGIKYRGASDQNYLDALGQKGAYQEHFLVYGRDGEKCLKCQGKIKRLRVGGRGSFYCPSCQR